MYVIICKFEELWRILQPMLLTNFIVHTTFESLGLIVNKLLYLLFVAGSKGYKFGSAYMGGSLQFSNHGSNSLGRKVGTWFTFGVNRKARHQHRDVSWDRTTLL